MPGPPAGPVSVHPVTRSAPPPLEVDDWRLVAAATALWVIALIVLVTIDLTGGSIPGWWLWMCGFGTALGLLGIRILRRRSARTPS
ncbi:MAG: hypothetical protein JWL64_2620 [Frankiales bacterium]|nr:hypothetical protein [Frankiales bacterium]